MNTSRKIQSSLLSAVLLNVLLLASSTRVLRAAPINRTIADRIVVYPARIDLKSRRDCRQVVVTGWFHGEPQDVTHEATFVASPSGAVQIGDAIVRAQHDGAERITVSVCGRTVVIPVTVTNSSKPDPVKFKFETLAVLTRQGCSTGSCHGAPHGKGGFILSLFGYNPNTDRISLTRDGFNRRIDVMEPADSLIIKKPMLELPHVGGKRLHKTDEAYQVLYNWISEGAPVDLPAVECTGISVYPHGEQVLRPGASTQQISVIANYSDGSSRDVTRISAYDTSAASVITVDAVGHVSSHTRGQASISVRYLDKLESVHFTMTEPVPGFVWNQPAPTNEIDRLVEAKLKQLDYLPSSLCDDSVFLRRVYLDLTGLLPTLEQARSFRADKTTSAIKRSRLIDGLLETEEYARFWSLKRADLMRVTPARLKGDRAKKFASWIVDAVRSNMPYDRFAREIITATGDTEKAPPACYFVAVPTTEERTEMTAEIFMGSRVECARCHNHPFESWTMKDYYSIGAVFARTQSDGSTIKLASSGETINPTTGETMKPFGLASSSGRFDDSTDRRLLFADWLVKPSNPYFARVAVNRIWAALMGRGIVEPIDDFRSSNPPTNGPLLDALAASFVKNGFDCKATIRSICNSHTYQRSSEPNSFNASDSQLFSHFSIRLLSAEQLKDAIGVATHALPSVEVERLRYATEAPYPENSEFTATFGQPERATSCACERQNAPTLLQALELLNGGTTYALANKSMGYYAPLEDQRLIDDLYLSALSRLPSDKEKAIAAKFLKRVANRNSVVTDLVWTIVNTREFTFQH